MATVNYYWDFMVKEFRISRGLKLLMAVSWVNYLIFEEKNEGFEIFIMLISLFAFTYEFIVLA